MAKAAGQCCVKNEKNLQHLAAMLSAALVGMAFWRILGTA